MKVYTKTGDTGTTSLVGGKRIAKSALRLEAYGTADELSACLGLLIAQLQPTEWITPIPFLIELQHRLFNLGGYLACESDTPYYREGCGISTEAIEHIERQIDNYQELLPKISKFILPMGALPSAQAHVARTVCRRLERIVCRLSEEENVDPNAIAFINRLSDYLFVLARMINLKLGECEIFWENV